MEREQFDRNDQSGGFPPDDIPTSNGGFTENGRGEDEQTELQMIRESQIPPEMKKVVEQLPAGEMKRNIMGRGEVMIDTQHAIVMAHLKESYSKPLIKIKNEEISEATLLEDVIDSETSLPNKLSEFTPKSISAAQDLKKAKAAAVTAILAKPTKPLPTPPKIIKVIDYNEENRIRIFKEEAKRRDIDIERLTDFENSIEEDELRRNIYDGEILIMEDEFALSLQKKYPWFVLGDWVRKDELEAKKIQLRTEKKRIQKNKIKRMESEKNRKRRERELRLNKLENDDIQTFFEEEILIDHRVNLSNNPELEGLSEIERTIRDIEQMELRLGRPIVPHRDIVESDESDFDVNAYTHSDDILIRPQIVHEEKFDIHKDRMFKELQVRLNPQEAETDFILMKESGISSDELKYMVASLKPAELEMEIMKRGGLSLDEMKMKRSGLSAKQMKMNER